MRDVVVLGSTGSIGVQALEIAVACQSARNKKGRPIAGPALGGAEGPLRRWP